MELSKAQLNYILAIKTSQKIIIFLQKNLGKF